MVIYNSFNCISRAWVSLIKSIFLGIIGIGFFNNGGTTSVIVLFKGRFSFLWCISKIFRVFGFSNSWISDAFLGIPSFAYLDSISTKEVAGLLNKYPNMSEDLDSFSIRKKNFCACVLICAVVLVGTSLAIPVQFFPNFCKPIDYIYSFLRQKQDALFATSDHISHLGRL